MKVHEQLLKPKQSLYFRLVIVDPTETKDAGIYQCMATNAYGTIYSDVAKFTFGGTIIIIILLYFVINSIT